MKENKKMWRQLLTILVVVVSISIVGISIYQKKPPVIIEFGMFSGSNWDVANANSYVIIDKVIATFEKEHPGVKVHYSSGIRKNDYSEWYAQKVLKGETPDVAMVLADDFDKLVSMGILQNLDEMASKDKEFQTNNYYETALNIGKKGNKQYTLPYEIVPTMMFVNKSLLNHEGFLVPEVNWTWEDLYKIAGKITKDVDNDGKIDQFGICNYGWQEAVYSNGTQLFSEDGKQSYFTNQKVIDSVKYVKKLNDLNQGIKVTQNDFDAGNVAFMPLSFADYRTYKTYPYKIKKYSTFKWDCITLPAGENGGNVSQVNALSMGISSKSKHKKLAWELLKMFTYSEETQMDIFRHSQGASPLKAVTNSPKVEVILSEDTDTREKVIDVGLLHRSIRDGVIIPKFSRYYEVTSFAEGEINKILSDEKNVESTLKIVQRNVISLLGK